MSNKAWYIKGGCDVKKKYKKGAQKIYVMCITSNLIYYNSKSTAFVCKTLDILQCVYHK